MTLSLSDYESRFVLPLQADKLLSVAPARGLARLLSHVRERHLVQGELLYRRGDEADALFLLQEGRLDLALSALEPLLCQADSGHVGEEAALAGQSYLADCTAATACRVLVVPRASLQSLLDDHPGLKDRFHAALLQRYGGQELRAPARKKNTPAVASWGHVAGWSMTTLAPLGVWLWGRGLGLDMDALAFLAVLSCVVCMWVFSLVDEYLPGLFAILATLTLGLAPADVPLSGFASDSFFMAMSILGLGTVIVTTGLGYRALLWLLSHMPNNRFGQHAGLMFTGFFLTPLVPSINGRVALIAPLFRDLLDIVQLPPRSRVTTQLAVGAFSGVTLLSAAFLSSKSVNFVVYDMLPEQWQEQFQWLFWLIAALAMAVVTLLVYGIVVAVWFRDSLRGDTGLAPRPRVDPAQLRAQRRLMGTLSEGEWAALSGILVFMLGVGTASFHHIDPPWLGLAVLIGLLMFGFLRKEEFRQKIDWPFLVYLGGIGGIVATFNYLQLDRWIARDLGMLASVLQGNLELFIVMLTLLVLLVRLVVPISATIVLLAAVFVPLADSVGVNPWVVAIIILVLGEMWFFPYQCSYYLQFRQLAGAGSIYDELAFLRFNALMNAVRLGALYASLPWWRMLGLL